MTNRNEIFLAARKESQGDIAVTSLLSDAMACESRFGHVEDVIEALRRFPTNGVVKERGGRLFVEYAGHDWDYDLAEADVPDWANTEF